MGVPTDRPPSAAGTRRHSFIVTIFTAQNCEDNAMSKDPIAEDELSCHYAPQQIPTGPPRRALKTLPEEYSFITLWGEKSVSDSRISKLQ